MNRAIVLAAGVGSRMSLGENGLPKTLLNAGHTRIIDRILRCLAANDVRSVKVVVGYHAEEIMDHVSRTYHTPEFDIEYVYNPWYASSNTACSLWLASTSLGLDDTILVNGDVILVDEAIDRLLECEDSCLAGIKHECGSEEVKIMKKGRSIVAIGKKLDPEKSWGEYIGVAKFGQDAGRNLKAALQSANDFEFSRLFYDDLLNDILKKCSLNVVDVSDLPLAEIDTPSDLDKWMQEFGTSER